LSRKVEVTQATADALVNELRRELESAQVRFTFLSFSVFVMLSTF